MAPDVPFRIHQERPVVLAVAGMVVAAENQLRPRGALQRLDGRFERRIIAQLAGQRGLGPDDEARAGPRRVPGQPAMRLHGPLDVASIPLRVLVDVPLDHRYGQRGIGA